MEEERLRLDEEEARANGFACYEDYARSETEKLLMLHEEMIADHCAATGHTREQADAVLWHQNESPNYSLPDPGPCHCHEHPIESFCPNSLIDYRSQDNPGQMAFSRFQNRLNPEELNIKEGDKSNRLDQKTLEKYWTMDSPETPRKIPFWASAEGQDTRRIAPTSPSPSLSQTPGLLYDEPTDSPLSAEDTTETSTTTSSDSNTGHSALYARGIPSLESSILAPANNHHRKLGPQAQARQRRKRHPRTTLRVTSRPQSSISGITKARWRPAMGLRSRTVNVFYQLAPDGKDCGCLMPPKSKFLAVPAGTGGKLKDKTLELDLLIPSTACGRASKRRLAI
ncbi:MAG: hypothetical protein Q9197_000527 [Variospora fuerteventurae]